MKTISISLLILLLPLFAFAQESEGKDEKEKKNSIAIFLEVRQIVSHQPLPLGPIISTESVICLVLEH